MRRRRNSTRFPVARATGNIGSLRKGNQHGDSAGAARGRGRRRAATTRGGPRGRNWRQAGAVTAPRGARPESATVTAAEPGGARPESAAVLGRIRQQRGCGDSAGRRAA